METDNSESSEDEWINSDSEDADDKKGKGKAKATGKRKGPTQVSSRSAKQPKTTGSRNASTSAIPTAGGSAAGP
ncbi:hypothetical protein OIO90_003574 [Microbotryomycetes sp. JL221]|nr:hypothetical protein OIO90_003574 [Microbotryomycetes sp. JL221]